MDLSYSPDHEAFRQEIRAFLAEHGQKAPKGGLGVASGKAGAELRAWQALLIEHGYAARTIPKE